jgi:hypothetical protein
MFEIHPEISNDKIPELLVFMNVQELADEEVKITWCAASTVYY